jgi:hypothetical protein
VLTYDFTGNDVCINDRYTQPGKHVGHGGFAAANPACQSDLEHE